MIQGLPFFIWEQIILYLDAPALTMLAQTVTALNHFMYHDANRRLMIRMQQVKHYFPKTYSQLIWQEAMDTQLPNYDAALLTAYSDQFASLACYTKVLFAAARISDVAAVQQYFQLDNKIVQDLQKKILFSPLELEDIRKRYALLIEKDDEGLTCLDYIGGKNKQALLTLLYKTIIRPYYAIIKDNTVNLLDLFVKAIICQQPACVLENLLNMLQVRSTKVIKQNSAYLLYHAVEYDHLGALNLLIAWGIDVGAAVVNLGSTNALHIAAIYGSINVAPLLCTKLPLEAPSLDGTTALSEAVFFRQSALVALLLTQGANPNTADNKQHRTPLHIIVSDESQLADLTILKLLLQYHANVNARAISQIADQTPLHLACANADIAAVRSLLEYGADLNAKNALGETPWLSACKHPAGMLVVEYFMQLDVDIYVTDNDNRTALHLAAMCSSIRLVKFLLQKKFAVNTRDSIGNTALHYAKDAAIAALLIQQGALVNVLNFASEIPLHYAVWHEYDDVVATLITHKSRVNLGTPILYEVALWDNSKQRAQKAKILRLLMEAGANALIQNVAGKYPYELAVLPQVRLMLESAAKKQLARHNVRPLLWLLDSQKQIDDEMVKDNQRKRRNSI